jgi:hypothetical protein
MRIKRCVPLIKLFLVPSLTLIIVGLSAYFSHKTSSQGPLLQLSNRTNSFEVAKVERNREGVRLTLKNNYNKTITAYAISAGGKSHNLRELSSEKLLTPGSTLDHDLKIQERRNAGNITILAVVFEDKTSDGDAAVAKEISDYRLGKKTQYDRIIPILKRVLATRDNEMQSALEEAQTAIHALPSDSADKPHFIIAGLSDAKASILMDLEEFKKLRQTEGNSILRERIGLIKRSLQRYCIVF